MVLFLRWQPGRQDPTKGAWMPASAEGEMRASVAWVEGGETYACRQLINPGPSSPTRLRLTERTMRERVRSLGRVRADLGRAGAVPDPARRAAALAPFVGCDVDPARDAALEGLRGCGPAGVPALHKLLMDDALLPHHQRVVETLARVGGAGAERELTAAVVRELAYWRRQGPQLPPGWWSNAGPGRSPERLRQQYSLALRAIEGLRGTRSADSFKAVRDFRTFWQSLPQLADCWPLTGECDRVLASVSRDQTAAVGRGTRPGPAEARLPEGEVAALWADLAGDDAMAACWAAWKLAGAPEQAVPFLRGRLHPAVPVADPARVARLLVDLDSERFEVREEATRELEKLVHVIGPALRRALEGRVSLEVRWRLTYLLERTAHPAPLTPELLQSLRSIELLEQVGGPEARRVLQGLARGAPGARLTQEAQASLDRLARRP
jgi:hypothetical protein